MAAVLRHLSPDLVDGESAAPAAPAASLFSPPFVVFFSSFSPLFSPLFSFLSLYEWRIKLSSPVLDSVPPSTSLRLTG